MFNEEWEKVLFTVSAAAVREAERRILSCEQCNPDGVEIPFEVILDEVMQFSGVHTDYIMEEPAKCRRCFRAVTEKTRETFKLMHFPDFKMSHYPISTQIDLLDRAIRDLNTSLENCSNNARRSSD